MSDQMFPTLRYVSRSVIPMTFRFLPPAMCTAQAHAMLLAIGLQESDYFQYRIQQPIGPARGFWQFEKIGIHGVLDHPRSGGYLDSVLETLRYPDSPDACYTAVMHNDVLACVFARLNLWTYPGRLPLEHEADLGWNQYLRIWRPGKPHPEKWGQCFADAWHETRIATTIKP